MNHSVVPTEECHFQSLYKALDVVAREQKYLALTQAPPWEQSLAHYRNVLAAEKAGIKTIHFTSSEQLEKELAELHVL